MKALLLCLISTSAMAGALDETNYCGPPKRDSHGVIVRRADVMHAFQMIHPCPSTGKKTGACPNWFKDHGKPLACGGCDSVSNMQWLNTETKHKKDSFERRIYGMGVQDTAACTVEIVK